MTRLHTDERLHTPSQVGAVTLPNSTFEVAEAQDWYIPLEAVDSDGQWLAYEIVSLPGVGEVYEIDGTLPVDGDRGAVLVTSSVLVPT